MVSVFGSIWIALTIYCFFKSEKALIKLILFSTVFQASYVLLVGTMDINASIVTCIAYILRKFINNQTIKIYPWGKRAIIYGLYLIFISIVAPNIFAGRQVTGITNNEYNFNTFHWTTIGFSFSNLAQPLTILLYILTGIFLYSSNERLNREELSKYLQRIFYFVAIAGIIPIVLKYFEFPTTTYEILIHNERDILGNTMLDIQTLGPITKFISTFYEASVCGAYLTAMFYYFLYSEIHYKKITLVICAILLLLNASSTGLITFLIVGILILVKYGLDGKFPKNIFFGAMILSIAAIAFCFFNSTFRNFILQLTIGKFSSGSFMLRTRVDKIAMNQFWSTYMIGLGVNSIQCYSFIASILTQTGIIGFVLWIRFVFGLGSLVKISSIDGKLNPLMVALTSIIISQFLGIQALNFVGFWLITWSILSVRNNRNLIVRKNI